MKTISIKAMQSHKLMVYAGQAVSSGGSFLLSWWIARAMGVDTFGTFALLWSVLLFVLSLHQAFITQPLQTFAGKMERAEQESYLLQLTLIQIGLSILVLLFGAILAAGFHWLDAAYTKEAFLLGGIIAGFLFHDFNKKVFYLKESYHLPFLLDSLLYGSTFAIIWFQHQQLTDVLVALNIAYAGTALLGMTWLPIRNSTGWLAAFDRSAISTSIKKHYHFSKWLLGTALLQWAAGNSFLIAAAGTLGVAAAGALRMGQHLAGLCHILFLAMENIAPARASRQLFKEGLPGLSAYLRDLIIHTGPLVFLFLSVISIAAPQLVEWLYGKSYIPYTYVIWGYTALYAIAFWAYPLRFALRALENTRPIFWAYLLSGAFALMAAVPMTKAWGINGTLAGLIIAQLISILVYSLTIIPFFYTKPINHNS